MSRLLRLIFKGYERVQNTGSTARDHLAKERTYLAWTRTSLGLIALGIGVERFERFRADMQAQAQARRASANSSNGEANIVYQTPPSPASYSPPSSSAGNFRFHLQGPSSSQGLGGERLASTVPRNPGSGAATIRPPLSLSSALAAAVQNPNMQGQAGMPSPSPLLPSFLRELLV